MSPDELKQYEDMANDYRYADSIFKPVVLKLLDEIRWLREYDEIMRDKMERISKAALDCVVETERKYEHLEAKYKLLLKQGSEDHERIVSLDAECYALADLMSDCPVQYGASVYCRRHCPVWGRHDHDGESYYCTLDERRELAKKEAAREA